MTNLIRVDISMKYTKLMTITLFATLSFSSNFVLAAEARLFAHHTVVDFDAWKKGYDAYAPEQKKAGVLRKSVYRSVDNPNEVTVIHDFEDIQKAKAFAASPDLAALMARIGVQGKPQVWITTAAEKN
jgi:quinol monooxygenase YgiN